MPAAPPSMLARLLADPGRSEGTVPYDELRGFLFAVLNAPELIPPSEWMPEIFGGEHPQYKSDEQAQAVMAELMALNNEIVAPLDTRAGGLPAGVVFRTPPLANFDDGAPLAAWARGFLGGYQWVEDTWDGVDEDFGSVIAALGFFSSRSFATAVFEARESQLADLAATTVELFAAAALDYQQIGRSVADAPDDGPAPPDTSPTKRKN
jgi:yecA family protein